VAPETVRSSHTALDIQRNTPVHSRENIPYHISPDTSVVDLVAFVTQDTRLILEKEQDLDNDVGIHQGNSFDCGRVRILQDWELHTTVATPKFSHLTSHKARVPHQLFRRILRSLCPADGLV
jgi:hypothetical protein